MWHGYYDDKIWRTKETAKYWEVNANCDRHSLSLNISSIPPFSVVYVILIDWYLTTSLAILSKHSTCSHFPRSIYIEYNVQICPCDHPYESVTHIKRSPFSCPVWKFHMNLTSFKRSSFLKGQFFFVPTMSSVSHVRVYTYCSK